jgi:hypothetical protein
LNLNQYSDLTTIIQPVFLEVVIQSWLRKEPTIELGSNDHHVLRYKMWMWMRITKRKSSTWMPRRMELRMKRRVVSTECQLEVKLELVLA